MELAVVSDQGLQERFGRLGGQRIDPELPVVALVSPPVLIFGAVVHGKQGGGGREAFHEGVEQRLGLRVDPMEILEDEEQGLSAALPKQHPPDGIQRPFAPLGGVELQEVVVLGKGVEQPEYWGDAVLERFVEGQEIAGHLRANPAGVVALGNLEVALEKLDQGKVRRRLAVRHRA